MTPDPATGSKDIVRYALISDIHANLQALEAVLADIDRRPDVAGVYHLGDLVGYSSQPNEVVDTLRTRGIAGVAGNYDSTVATDYPHCGCRAESERQEELAHISYEYTRRAVSAGSRLYLASLPFRIDIRPLGAHIAGPTLTLVHAHPSNALIYVTEDRSDDFLRKMAQQAGLRAGDVLCFGHTHQPWHRMVDGVHFVNTGSVGRPKDGDWRAGYVLLEFAGTDLSVEFARVDYDVATAVAGVRSAGLPEDFIGFLETGGAPPARHSRL
jgi:predicted phosphodiesterase